MTMTRKPSMATKTMGFTWVPWASVGTKVRQACTRPAGSRATMPTVMMSDMPFPIP